MAADHSIYYLYENDSPTELRYFSARLFNTQTKGWAEAVKQHLIGSLSNEDGSENIAKKDQFTFFQTYCV